LNLKELESLRISVLKKLRILKFLVFIWALLLLFLAFELSKDLVIALTLSIFLAFLFFNLSSKKLKAKQRGIQKKALTLFLQSQKAFFKQEKLSQKAFEKLDLIQNLRTFTASGSFEFENFRLYDIEFYENFKGYFCGILVQSFKNKENLNNKNIIYTKYKQGFSIENSFGKNGNFLIGTLQNPFFIDPNKTLDQNFQTMQANLKKLKEKFKL